MARHEPFRNFVHSRTKPDGTVVHIAISGRPVVDDGGRFTGYRGIGADITERMDAEREPADKEALLRLSLDNMSDGIYVLDSELRYLTFNDRYVELLGVSYDELQVGKPVGDVVLRLARDGFYGLERGSVIGKTLHDLFPKHDADRCAAITLDVLDSGRVTEREYSAESMDEERVFSTVMFPIHGGSGGTAYAHGSGLVNIL